MDEMKVGRSHSKRTCGFNEGPSQGNAIIGNKKLFGHKMADFHVTVEAMWSNDGTWEEFHDEEEKITPSKVKVKAKAREDNSLIESAEIEMSDEDEEEYSEEADDDCG